MKLSRILFSFAAFGLVAVGVNAARNDNDGVLHLPVYRIEVPRQSDAERAIARNLRELADRASIPISVRPEVPLIRDAKAVRSALPMPARVAKF
ncbi:MAG TPA: hypothetical protein VGM73_09925 [Candidatus Didemnitutus sp.]|jgi:hypothetical protein